MINRRAFSLLLLAVVCLFADAASAQTPIEFLGPKYDDTVKLSPKYQIPYRDNGFAEPLERKRAALSQAIHSSAVDLLEIVEAEFHGLELG